LSVRFTRRDLLTLLGAGAVALIGRDRLAYASPGPESLPDRRAQAATAGAPSIPAAIRLQRSDGSICLIDMEEYLRGVVPAEAFPSWSAEALKAQAVAARTYAASYVATYGYICGTSACQNWDPSRRTAATDAAVDATRGELMTFSGEMIWAYYSSTCGGQTATSPDAASVYCRSVRCSSGSATDLSSEAAAAAFWKDSSPAAFCKDAGSSLYRWTYTTAKAAAEAVLDRHMVGNVTPTYSTGQLGQLTSVAVTAREYSGKVSNLLVNGKWSLIQSSTDSRARSVLRTVAGGGLLPSATVVIAYDGSNLTRWGGGFGHGIGLCQYGAQGMARAGHDYHAILQRYYTGVAFTTVSPTSYGVPARRAFHYVLPWASRGGAACA
jgi:stage II sporulation protein D